MCTTPHVEPATHAFEPQAVVDSLLVCVVEEVEKKNKKKKKKRKMLQELEQQEAAVGVSTIATDLQGVALTVSVSCCPHYKNSIWSACLFSLN